MVTSLNCSLVAYFLLNMTKTVRMLVNDGSFALLQCFDGLQELKTLFV